MNVRMVEEEEKWDLHRDRSGSSSIERMSIFLLLSKKPLLELWGHTTNSLVHFIFTSMMSDDVRTTTSATLLPSSLFFMTRLMRFSVLSFKPEKSEN